MVLVLLAWPKGGYSPFSYPTCRTLRGRSKLFLLRPGQWQQIYCGIMDHQGLYNSIYIYIYMCIDIYIYTTLYYIYTYIYIHIYFNCFTCLGYKVFDSDFKCHRSSTSMENADSHVIPSRDGRGLTPWHVAW